MPLSTGLQDRGALLCSLVATPSCLTIPVSPLYSAPRPPPQQVGSTPEFDAATKSFKRYWDDTASLAGSVLVYSTGRSIGQVMSLFKEKGGALAVPDAIVTAVGTKIFFRESGAEGEWCWREDEAWKAQLDKGWDLVPVKAACQAVIQAHDGRVQWLDQGTEHPHRVAVSCAVEAVEAVQARLAALFASADVEVKIIVSGEGAWRYVDCVAFRGGKQESLEYLRKHYGMPLERTVAAGDSGNDVLMLGGKHQALIVGNCQPDLLKWHLLQPQTGRCVLTVSLLRARAVPLHTARLLLFSVRLV